MKKLIITLFMTLCSVKAAPLEASLFAKPKLSNNAPLSALIKLNTNDLEDIKVSIVPKPNGSKLSYEVGAKSLIEYGGIPIVGLYNDYLNTVIIKAKYCTQSCEEITKSFHIKTPKLLVSAELKSKPVGLINRLMMFSAINGNHYGFDANAELRFALLNQTSNELIQSKNNQFLSLNKDSINQINLLGQISLSIPKKTISNAFAQDNSSNIHFDTKTCNEFGCERKIISLLSDGRAYKEFSLSSLLEPSRTKLFANLAKQVCTLNESNTELDQISSIAALNDGLIFALPKINAIARINNDSNLVWLFAAPLGFNKSTTRKLLKVINAKQQRLNCSARSCKDANDEVFYYPGDVQALKVLGHINGNIILALYDKGDFKELMPAKSPAVIRVFEIDERRLNIKEIWSDKLDFSQDALGYINGDLSYLDVLDAANKTYKLYSYNAHAINVLNTQNTIEFSADFSSRKASTSRLLLYMQLHGFKPKSVFKLNLSFN